MSFLTRKRKKIISLTAGLFVLMVGFQNCSEPKISFTESLSNDPLDKYEVDNSGEYNTTFKFSNDLKTTFTQENLGLNSNTIKFRINSTNPVDPKSLAFSENGKPITKFTIESNGSGTGGGVGNVDIALVIDNTGSMGSTIESVKIRLTNFVNKVYDMGSSARICISTFGDRTMDKCSKFYSINAKDPASAGQRNALFAQLSSIKASGGGDANENPMRALLDVLSADWLPGNQQFIILVTDAGFSYAPDNKGDAGDYAPAYADVMNAFQNKGINIFAATPVLPGYNQNFGSYKSIVAHTDGEWFSYKEMAEGLINFDTILDRIVKRVNSFYTVKFISEENALDPSLPTSSRKITVTVKTDPAAQINDLNLVSTLPSGRAEYKKVFPLTHKSFDPNKVSVKINGVATAGFKIDRLGNIDFDNPPSPGAKVEVSMKAISIKESTEMQSIVFSKNLDPNSIYVTLNGKAVGTDVYKLEKSIEGRYSIILNDSVFDNSDPYQISRNNGLKIKVKYLYLEDTTGEAK